MPEDPLLLTVIFEDLKVWLAYITWLFLSFFKTVFFSLKYLLTERERERFITSNFGNKKTIFRVDEGEKMKRSRNRGNGKLLFFTVLGGFLKI